MRCGRYFIGTVQYDFLHLVTFLFLHCLVGVLIRSIRYSTHIIMIDTCIRYYLFILLLCLFRNYALHM